MLRPRKPKFVREILIDIWKGHFALILQFKDTKLSPNDELTLEVNEDPDLFSRLEVDTAIRETKKRKSGSPDNILNEHLRKAAPIFSEIWTTLFNECLRRTVIPKQWRNATVKVLYKGTGYPESPHSYRSIALECALYKVFTKLVTKRLMNRIEHKIPEEQFGFRKGRSAVQAISCMLDDINEALRLPKGKLFAIFVDYTKAFDYINRTMLIEKLSKVLGPQDHLTRLVTSILARNTVRIEDSLSVSRPLEQTNGVLQGNPLSPLMFNIETRDVIEHVRTEGVKAYLYADDMALVSTSKEDLQTAFDRLSQWAEANDLTLNQKKTVSMTFKKWRKTSSDGRLLL